VILSLLDRRYGRECNRSEECVLWVIANEGLAPTNGSVASSERHRELFTTSLPAAPTHSIMSQAGESGRSARSNRQPPPSHNIFSVPTPIKQLFDQFPLLTYPVNDLPQRAPRHRDAHVLHVFTTDEGAIHGAPSYNPACLKWQVSLHTLSPTSHHSSSQHRRRTSSSPR
jgi:hypothetical protein